MSTLLKSLKSENFINEECHLKLSEMPSIFEELFLKKVKRRQYSAELKAFALTLNFYSPKAYLY